MRTSPHTAAELKETFGVSRNKLFSLMLQNFSIPSEYQDALVFYGKMHFSGKNFHSQLYDGCTTLQAITFAVNYLGCSALEAKNATELELSFRAAAEEFNLQPICLVRIAQMEPSK